MTRKRAVRERATSGIFPAQLIHRSIDEHVRGRSGDPMNRVWMSTALAAGAVVVLFAARTSAQSGVTWTNLVHVAATASVLRKDSGCDGCLDAGAASLDEISTGD